MRSYRICAGSGSGAAGAAGGCGGAAAGAEAPGRTGSGSGHDSGGGTAPLVATYLLSLGGGSPRFIVLYLAGLGLVAAACGVLMRPYGKPQGSGGAKLASAATPSIR